MFKLSQRMQLIYDQLIQGEPVWDFCCDHGYMGLNAYESGDFPEVHFVDQVDHIIAQLKARFFVEYHKEDFPTKAHFYSQSGETLNVPLSGSVVIAGVGAHTILRILHKLNEKNLLLAQRLILCPQRDEEMLSTHLHQMENFRFNFCNVHYEVRERGRTRKLLIFDKK